MFHFTNIKPSQKFYFALASFLLGTGFLFPQGNKCESIQPFCAGSTLYVFQNSNPFNSDFSTGETGPAYGCLEAQPYPAWFFLQVEDPGRLEFEISQTVNPDGTGGSLDVDFAAWGPFSEDGNFCSNSALSSQNLIGCSYSPQSVEYFDIVNAREGEIYVVVITNYSQKAGYISLQQMNISDADSGTTDCSIVNILGEDQRLCEEEPIELIANNVIATDYEWLVFDENSGDFQPIPNQTADRFSVSETGLYQVITTNNITGTELRDQVHIEFFDPPEVNVPEDLAACTRESITSFDLTETGEELTQFYAGSREEFLVEYYGSEENFRNDIPVEDPSDFQGSDHQEIIATITNQTSGCRSAPVKFSLLIFPEINIEIGEDLVICLDQNGNLVDQLTIGEDLGPGYTYAWDPPNDPDGDGEENAVFEISDIPEQALISVKITREESGCSSRFDVGIELFVAPAEVQVEVSGEGFNTGYTVTASAADGNGDQADYEYQLDNGNWQAEPVFTMVPAGLHTISARHLYGCGSVTSPEFRLFGYPRFFTPNADGFNDTWKIFGDENFSIEKILIFDRYGKLLKQISGNSDGWDGSYNGKALPADDYWFLLHYQASGTGEKSSFKGHFSLKR